MWQTSALYIFTIWFVVSDIGAWGQSEKKCADVGEYCQVHWDCCSDSCMTYLYRCMRRSPLHANKTKPSTTVEELVANWQLNETQQEPEYNTFMQPVLQNRFAQFDEEKATKAPEKPTLFDIVLKSPSSKQEQINDYQRDLGQAEVFSTTVNVADRIGESVTTPPCKKVGEKCYRHEECCTHLCHGFLHQCVT